MTHQPLATILAIDVGPERSAYCELRAGIIGKHAWIENPPLLNVIADSATNVIVLESPQAQDRPLGKLLRDTIFWAGRFYEHADGRSYKTIEAEERDVAFWLTGNRSAGNPAVLQSLKDIFGDKRQEPCRLCDATGYVGFTKPAKCKTCKGRKFTMNHGPLCGMNEHERSALAAAWWYWKRSQAAAAGVEIVNTL